ncbi:MAG: AraC family transcriptional regulator [Fluviicola sp.]|nr:AraC family transcriptional regulator [Fluviicola sp.]
MRKTKSIPLNTMNEQFSDGIAIAKTSTKDLEFDIIKQAHRDDYHLFLLSEKGTALFEIDFQKYKSKPNTVIYIQPYQVHRILTIDNVEFSALLISNENLNPEYLKLLKDIAPANPLALDKETFAIISETAALCIKIANRKEYILDHLLLKDSCNTLIGLVISQYLIQSKPVASHSRFEVITKAFQSVLESNFITTKRPSDYSDKLKISAVYLNECVKKTTGHPVSHHIQQRIILEAKRLLYHSNKSVKEIAFELGYDDYPYFSRLFKKVTGITALTFRNKNKNMD